MIAFFGAVPNFLIDRYRVTINFPSAPGVGPDTPVRKSGVKIGRVARVKLLDDNQGVNLDLEIERQYRVRQGETCRIAIGSLITNDAVVEFVPGASDAELLLRFDGVAGGVSNGMLDPEERNLAQTLMANGDTIRGGIVKGDPLDVLVNMQGNFAQTFSAIERASQKVESLAGSVEDVIGGGRGEVREVMDKVKGSLTNFQDTLGTINRVAIQVENSRLPEAIAESVERLPEIFDEARKVLIQTQNVLRSFEEFGRSIEGVGGEFQGIGESAKEAVQNANFALQNIGKFTEPLGENADALVGNLGQTLVNLDALLSDLRVFAGRLNNGNGTVARLIEDQQLYFELLQAIQNVRMLTQRLQPIADDVRVFTDKIARDPGQLGVRGALQGRPTGAGLK